VRVKLFLLLCAFALCFLQSSTAGAVVLQPAPSLAHEVLSESVPSAFAPDDFDTSDFSVEWTGKKLDDADVFIEQGTLQWVRVSEILVLPRARISIVVHGVEAGQVTNAGFAVPLTIRAGRGVAVLPAALISGPVNPIRVTIWRGGQELSGQLQVRFNDSKKRPSRVFFDASCSRFGLNAASHIQSPNDWMFVGCRAVTIEGGGHRTSSLELYVYWDGVGQTMEVGGIETWSTLTSTWLLRLSSEPGNVTLRAGKSQVTLRYHIAEYLHYGSLGLGIGPYHYTFRSPFEDVSSYSGVVTLYGSYFITETFRVVVFDATEISSQYFTDLGVYVNTEYFRFLDRRVVASLLLGGHVNGFRTGGKYHLKVGIPQGVEASFIDAFAKGHNLSVGAFIYPPIDGTSYYNTWLRWGTPRIFGEVNYISWREKLGRSGDVYTQTFGLSLGLSLFRFL